MYICGQQHFNLCIYTISKGRNLKCDFLTREVKKLLSVSEKSNCIKSKEELPKEMGLIFCVMCIFK